MTKELAERKNHLYTKINHEMGRAIDRFRMIEDGDRILVAVSGGKDSLLLLRMLLDFQKKAPVRFDLLAVHVDQGQPGYDPAPLVAQLDAWQVPYHIEHQNTYDIVLEKTAPGKTYCTVCSRLRRGILYRLARERDCNSIALGHHREDMIHTFLLNAMFAGKMGGMPAAYTIREQDLRVIRPLASVHEDWIREYVQFAGWILLPCNLCGSQEGLKRKEVAELLVDLEKRYPVVKESLFAALNRVALEELLDVDSQKRYGIESRFDEQKVPLL
jgi:tRNA 2-thiocytidine biosynthesis protein TtcA